MINDYFSLSVKNLRRRKLRSLLTILGIFISIATIFILISISIGLQNAVTEEFRTLGVDKFFVAPKDQQFGQTTGSAVNLTTSDVDAIRGVNGVKSVSYYSINSVEVDFKNSKRFVMALGFPPDSFQVLEESLSISPSEGRILQKGDVSKVMVGSLFLTGNVFPDSLHEGNTLTVDGTNFKVESVLEPIGNPIDDKLVYMYLDDYKKLFNNTYSIDRIIVQVNPGANLTEVSSRVEKRLNSFRGLTKDTEDYIILTPEELLSSFGTILNIITAFLLGVAAISLLVGGIGIANTMYTSVLERTKEIGTMKAVGARNSEILLIFLLESGLLGLIGGIIGVLFGFSVSKLIELIANKALGTNLLQTASPWYLFLGCLAFAFLIGAVSGVLPAYRASKVKPVDALRYE